MIPIALNQMTLYNRTVLINLASLSFGLLLVVVSFYASNLVAQVLFLVSGGIASSYSVSQVSAFLRKKATKDNHSEIDQLLGYLSEVVIITDRNGIVSDVSPQAKDIFSLNSKVTTSLSGEQTEIESAVYRLLRSARRKHDVIERLRLKDKKYDFLVKTIMFTEDKIFWLFKPSAQGMMQFFKTFSDIDLPIIYHNSKTGESQYNPAFHTMYIKQLSNPDTDNINIEQLFSQPITVSENILMFGNDKECRVTLKAISSYENWTAFSVSTVSDTVATVYSNDAISTFINYCPVGAVTLDVDGTVLEANRVALDTVGVSALVGHSISVFSQKEDQPIILQTLRHVANSSASMRVIQFETCPDKFLKTRYLQMFVRKVPVDKTFRMIGVLIDKTKTKDLETQFAQSQKMQAVGKLAGGVAHDFNNLLTAISGHCDLLLLRHQTGDPDFADLTQIQQNSNRAANLVRQLLAFSRQQTLTPKVIYFSDVLIDFRHLLDRLLGERITVRMQQQPDIWPVKADQGQLEQVIMNLAVNAQDAMPDGGTLTITTQNVEITSVIQRDGVRLPEGQYVNIRVSDTGTGMPEHVRAKVFEPFFTTKGIGKGTGLGLSTVYGIIKQTGGFVFVDSAEGEGTTFDIFLPHTPHSKEDQKETDQPAEVKRDLTGQGTILLVEDEDSVRAFASRALETRGYKVLAVDCGESALELLREIDFNIDLMVSDVVMPEMDGPTLMHKVRDVRPDMKVIFMSGYAEEAFRKNLHTDEKYGFIPKPFSLKQLATVVKDTLSE